MKEIRLLREEDIEARVQSCNKAGVKILLYKTARCDMDILDETFGNMNWQRRHCRDNHNCIVSIWDEDKKQWIEKEDTGTESNMEAQKGLASDSFKRACFNIGIGRELYTAPDMFVFASDLKTLKEDRGRWVCYDRFSVAKIEYEGRKISYVALRNESNRNIIEFRNTIPKTYINQKQTNQLLSFLKAKNYPEEKALKAVSLKDFSRVTVEQYNTIVRLAGES